MTPRKTTIIKNTGKSVQRLRLSSQLLFTLISIWIGVEFYLFAVFLETHGVHGSSYRPAGVEAYLPISALMSLVYFIQTGSVHQVHPAGFFIFSGIVLMSFILGKSFCSWVCPVGFVSDLIGEFGEKIFRRNLKLPRWADYPLRSLKYLLLLFFVTTILSMSVPQLAAFLDSDYNIIADMKLFDFFRFLSPFSIVVLTILVLLSIPIKNFWCRYLCPYGALLGLTGLLSVLKIKRTAQTCIDCSLCDEACPSSITVSKARYVISDECTSCMQCVDACPVKDTLSIHPVAIRKKVSTFTISIIAVLVFCAVLFFGIMTRQWSSNIPVSKYMELYENRDGIGH
jgi:polyferredoxin